MALRSTTRSTGRRAALALAAAAAGLAVALTGCSGDDSAKNGSSARADSFIDGERAKNILVSALDSDAATVHDFVDVSDPDTVGEVAVVSVRFRNAGVDAGSITVTEVEVGGTLDGHPKATAATRIDSDDWDLDARLDYVEIDGTWLLSAGAMSLLDELTRGTPAVP